MKEKKKNNKCDVPVGHQPAFYFFTRFMCSFFLGSTQVGRFIVKFVVILGALNRSTFFLELHIGFMYPFSLASCTHILLHALIYIRFLLPIYLHDYSGNYIYLLASLQEFIILFFSNLQSCLISNQCLACDIIHCS